jgi:hypothetical protein
MLCYADLSVWINMNWLSRKSLSQVTCSGYYQHSLWPPQYSHMQRQPAYSIIGVSPPIAPTENGTIATICPRIRSGCISVQQPDIMSPHGHTSGTSAGIVVLGCRSTVGSCMLLSSSNRRMTLRALLALMNVTMLRAALLEQLHPIIVPDQSRCPGSC